MKKFSSFNKESSDSNENAELFEQFIEKYGSVENNAEKSKQSVKLFEDVFSELDNLVKKEELSELFLSQLNAANKQFAEFKKSVNKLVDEKNNDISQSVYTIVNKANNVLEKVDTESKSYNKRYYTDLEKTEEKFNKINEKLDTVELQTIQEKIDQFKENLLELNEVVNTTLPQQNKKVEKFIIENQEAIKNVNNTGERLQLAVTEILKDFETKLDTLSETFLTSDSLDSTNKKYNKKIVEVHNQFEKIRKEFTRVDNHYTLSKDQFKDVGDKLNSLTENIFAVEQRIKGERDKQNYKIVEADTKLDKKIEDVATDMSSLKDNFISDIGKVENNLSEIVSKDIKDTKDQLEEKISRNKLEQHKVDTKLKKTFNEEFKTVKKDIRSANTKINNQLNKYKLLEDKTRILVDEVKLVFKDKKLTEINNKIKFLEETLEKFNEKTVLTEELVNNPSETNKDPLTPLNQNFVTFDQLKKHYQLFINRIQQQLMTVGGGGAVRIDQLDDVNIRDTQGTIKATNGQSLVYITASGKFEPISVGAAAGEVSTVGGAQGAITNAQILSFVTRAVTANGGNLSLSGNIIPDADSAHSLGTESLRFKDLFLSGNTFKLGGLTLKDTGGKLAVTDSTDAVILDASADVPSLDGNANIGGYKINDGVTNDQANSRISNIVVSSGLLTGANIGSTLTGGTDIEITGAGTINYTGGGGGGSGVASVGGYSGTMVNTQISNIVISSGVLRTNNVTEDTNLYFTNDRANAMIASNAIIGGYSLSDGITNPQSNSRISNIIISSGLITGANIGGALTGGTDIEVTAGGTINYTGSGGSGVASIGGYSGTMVNTQISNIVISSGVLKAANISDLVSTARGSLSKVDGAGGYNTGTGEISIPATTAHISEGTNLYYANGRANSTIVANLNYSNVDYMSNLVGSVTQIQLTSEKNFIRFYADNQSGFPNAGNYHGAIMHSHADAAMYFAHGGAWVKLIDQPTLDAVSIGGYSITSSITNPQSNSRISNIVVSSGVLKTANVSELTNLYFTDARSRAAISLAAAGSRAYNSGTGEITIPGTSDHVTEGTTNLFYSNARVAANVQHSLERSLTLAASDETTDLTTGTGKVTFRAPFPMRLTQNPRLSVQTAPTGAALIVNIKEGGSSIFSTKPQIDDGAKTSKTSGTTAVMSDTVIADDAELTVDIDQVGSTAAGKGLKLTVYYEVNEV